MSEIIHRVADVFGIGRELPLNYVERKKVDQVFMDSLTRDKHLVVYGSSKQGKTSLRKNWLKDDEHIVVSCINTMNISDLNGAILKAAGYKIELSESKTISGNFKVTAEFKGKGKVPLIAEAEGGVGLEHERGKESQVTHARLELDLADVNDVVAALKEVGFDQFVVLEDFHYLPVETQRNFAFALKTFHENSDICFIVVGVWREKNRLVYYNGDLTSRVVAIDADEWSKEELAEVIKVGGNLMNVTFHPDFVAAVLEHAFDAVYLVQEACLKACEAAGVYRTGDENRLVGEGLDAKAIIKDIVAEQAGRYTAFVTNFSEGFQKTGLEMYRWLIYAVISAERDALQSGLRRTDVAALIKAGHPEGQGLNEGNITQALQNTASLQVNKNVRPIILDYDQTTRVLSVVDRSFLIWLAYQEKKDVLAEIDL